MRGSVGLVVAPAVFVGITPLGGIEWEIVDELRTHGLVVTPSVSVRVKPLRGLYGEGVRTVVNGPVQIAIGIRIAVGVNAPVTVAGGRATNEGACIGLGGVVNELTDVPQHPRVVERRIVPVVTIAVIIGIVPLRRIQSESICSTCRMGKPRFETVQATGVRVGVGIAIRIQTTEAVGRGVAAAVGAVVALVPFEVVAKSVVVGVQPL